MTEQHLPAQDNTTSHDRTSSKRHALTSAARATVVGALALGLTGFVVAGQVTSEAGAAETQASASDSSWDMRAGSVMASRDILGGRASLEMPALRTFTVSVDGATVEVESNANSLAEALRDTGIVLGPDDVVSSPLNVLPMAGTVITILRVSDGEVVEETIDPHGTSEVRTNSLYTGESRVKTPGVDGRTVTTYATVMVDGEEQSREIVAQLVVQNRVDEVVEVGTKERPVATAPRNSGSGGTSSSPAPAPSAYSGDAIGTGQSMAAARGWTGDQWSCLYNLWQKESNWNPSAMNRSSGAYGIPQSLPGSKMASHGADWQTNPATQIAWGLDYIAGRYGTPCAAWNHSVAKNWY
ncbi:MAG TPA: G5 domain-containing protein [Actinomycetaceae bacterium]|nr:G5 domain-containing protein [Actinomycetaceae bacterium]